MAKKAKGTSKSAENKELKSLINENVQYGLNVLETMGDRAVELAGSMLEKSGTSSSDVKKAAADYLTQAKKAQKEAIASLRKQAKDSLGN